VTFSAIRLGVLLLPPCLVAAGAVSAQTVTVPASERGAPPAQLRVQMSQMEAILERAVQVGIQGAMNQMPGVQFQGPPMFVSPRARGFKIDNYGVFFDVEVPVLPASITWSINVLNRNNEVALVNEINQLKAIVKDLPDEGKRAEIRKGLDRMQARVSAAALSEPAAASPQGASPTLVRDGAAPAPSQAPVLGPDDMDAIYTSEVKKALTSVILDHGIALELAPDDWFTVAASEARSGWGPPDTMTLYLSIRGRDLAALRARQITREEAIKRMVDRNY
jgi:hypothetical protein